MKNKARNFNIGRDKGYITISTSIDPMTHKIAKKHKISWAKAMDIGLRVVFYSIDNKKYPLSHEIQSLIKKVDKVDR